MKLSFKRKLIFSHLFVILVSFGFIAFYLSQNLEEHSLKEIKSTLINEAKLVESQIPAPALKNEDINFLEPLAKDLGRKINCRITIITPTGEVLADSEKTSLTVLEMENHRNRPEIISAFSGETGIQTRYSATLKIDMLYMAMPLKDKNEIIAVLRLALPLTSVQKILLAIRKTIFLGLFFALGLAFVLASMLATQTVKPINRMINISHKFAQGDFSRRVILDSKDEIQELADTLNYMAQQIQDKMKLAQDQNQKLAAVFSSMIEGVIVVDKDETIISLNPAIEKIFGVKERNAKGRTFLEAIPNSDIAEIINRVLKTGKAQSLEINLSWPVNGNFKINAVPIFADIEVSGCLAVIHDITEIRKLEIVRRDFVANVSHELKTPLTSITGFVETLLEGALNDKEHNRNFLKTIQEHAQRLNNLVDDLLSLSQLESQEIKLKIKELNLNQQVDEAISGFKSQVKKKDISIENNLAAKISLKADPDKIQQVLTNLIDNAIKFNRSGGFIKIYSQEAGKQIKIIVEDSGIGIPEKDLPRIFERFYRVDKARSKDLGGTGLGLSIVKHTVELHSGSVGVESVEGLGSKFWFTLTK